MGFGGSAERARNEARAWAERDIGDLHPLRYDWLLIVHVADEPDAMCPLEELFEELRSVTARPILLRDAERRPI
jgi:hypothetical protein